MSKYAIEVKNVKKSFYLPHHRSDSLKSTITQIFKTKEKGGSTFNALKDISFNVEKGDFFGILGRNGSGKSTLLKIISDIYQPTKGSVRHDGKLVSFIELGVGFKAELTGRENVFLNGALLGFSKDEIAEMYNDIVSFAELEEFMDQKLKNYSSGMKVRLAFSVAIRAKADILILDEVLAVGDAAFQKKCTDYFETLKNNGKTVILVTHSMGNVRQFCNKAVVIDEGRVVFEGNPEEAAIKYEELFIKEDSTKDRKEKKDGPFITARIIGSPVKNNTEILEVEVKYRNTDTRKVYPKIVLYYQKIAIMGANGKILHNIVTEDTEEHTVIYKLPLRGFHQSNINVMAVLVDSEEEISLTHFGYDNELPFRIKNEPIGNKIGGVILDSGIMELKND